MSMFPSYCAQSFFTIVEHRIVQSLMRQDLDLLSFTEYLYLAFYITSKSRRIPSVLQFVTEKGNLHTLLPAKQNQIPRRFGLITDNRHLLPSYAPYFTNLISKCFLDII